MSGRVLLHIGAMKTGTTFIQSVLGEHPEQLAAAGAEFLASFPAQVRAVRQALQRGDPQSNLHRWRQLVAGVREDRTSIVSMEFLSFARPEQVAAFLQPLRGCDVHVVLTVRDQVATLPAQWQSYVRNSGTVAWAEYLHDVCVMTPPLIPRHAYRTYNRAQDWVRIVDTWRGRPEVGRFDVVSVPPPGAPPEELWLRFCRAAELTVSGISLDAVKDNPSIGYASSDVLRRLNEHLSTGTERAAGYRKLLRRVRGKPAYREPTVPIPGYWNLVKKISDDTLAPLRAEETKPLLNRDAAAYAIARNREFRDLLADGEIRFVGSPDDLPVHAALTEFPATVAPPPATQQLRAAEAVWGHVARVTGQGTARPDSLDDLVRDAGRMLRAVADKNRPH